MTEKCDDKEYWDVKCVDQFARYWGKHLTDDENNTLFGIWKKINSLKTKQNDIMPLYREAIDILHGVYCRQHPECDCELREANVIEGDDEGIGFLGVSVLKKKVTW